MIGDGIASSAVHRLTVHYFNWAVLIVKLNFSRKKVRVKPIGVAAGFIVNKLFGQTPFIWLLGKYIEIYINFWLSRFSVNSPIVL